MNAGTSPLASGPARSPAGAPPQVCLLTAVANSPHFRRNLRIVALIDSSAERYVVLCSTDTSQPAEQIVRYYRLRYQVEFVIWDAKG